MTDSPVARSPRARSPLALQMAARVEKLDPPLVADVCAAAALSVITLLEDPRSQSGSEQSGEWSEAVAAWNGARIRKLMRRGRASAWLRAQEVDGVTVSVGTADVRAFVPGPMDDAPPALAKLQIQSSSLAEPERVSALPDGVVGQGVLLIAVTPEVDMSWGKQAAQCAHAGQRAWEMAGAEQLGAWALAGRRIVVVHPTTELWDELCSWPGTRIHDGGFTEIPAGTLTALGLWLPLA